MFNVWWLCGLGYCHAPARFRGMGEMGGEMGEDQDDLTWEVEWSSQGEEWQLRVG